MLIVTYKTNLIFSRVKPSCSSLLRLEKKTLLTKLFVGRDNTIGVVTVCIHSYVVDSCKITSLIEFKVSLNQAPTAVIVIKS